MSILNNNRTNKGKAKHTNNNQNEDKPQKKKLTREEKEERKRQRKANIALFKEDVYYNLRGISIRDKLVAFGKLLILFMIMIGIPAILVFLLKDISWDTLTNLPTTLQDSKNIAWLLLIGLQMLQIVVSVIPGQPIQYAAGYLYGLFFGYVISIVGAILGTFIVYKLAAFLGHDSVQLLVGKERYRDYIRKLNSGRAVLITLLIYIIPGIPKDVMGYIAGISDMRLSTFIIVSTIGRSPGILVSLFVGIYFGEQNYIAVAIIAVFIIIILAICYKFKDKIMDMISSFENNYDSKMNN